MRDNGSKYIKRLSKSGVSPMELFFLLVVVGVVDAFHKDFAVGDAVGEGVL